MNQNMVEHKRINPFKTEAGRERADALYEAYLSRIEIPYEAQFIETAYGQTYTLLAGPVDAPRVVLLHGNALFGPHIARHINALAHKYRVITPDVIGMMGRSDPIRPDRAGPAYGEWLAEVIRVTGDVPVQLIGISNGAWLIIKLASVAPDLIRSAMLLSPAGFAPPNWLEAVALIPALGFGMLLSPEKQSRAFLRRSSPPGFEPSDLAVRLMAVVLRDYRRDPLPPLLLNEEIRALSSPTCILWGEFDRQCRREKVFERARMLLSDLRGVEILPGMAHGLEGTEALNRRLFNWLARFS